MVTRTLLLTTWYFPVRVLCWQDAVRMVYVGSVDVVAEYEEEIRSPSVTWNMPAVVRLRKNALVRKAAVKFSRQRVYERDRFTCQYCGRVLPAEKLTFDHVVPRSRGGRTDFINIVTACKPCNGKKGNQTCDQAGMFPLTQPRVPSPRLLPSSLDVSSAPEQWEPFLAPYVA
jgi:5-methylcytosine-specific restriction endonuclease McrA